MSSVLETLFCSDLRFAPSQELAKQYATALDKVLETEKTVKVELGSELWSLVETYLDCVKMYHALDAQMEFERGFLMGTEIMLEILPQKRIAPEQK